MADADTGKVFRAFRQIPLFAALTDAELTHIIGISRGILARPGFPLVNEGDLGDGMYVLIEGQAEAHIRMAVGDPKIVATFRPGDVFGELSLIDGAPRSATVVAKTLCKLSKLPSTEFEGLRLDRNPIAAKILRALAVILCERLRNINKMIDDIYANPAETMRILEQLYLREQNHPTPPRGRGGKA